MPDPTVELRGLRVPVPHDLQTGLLMGLLALNDPRVDAILSAVNPPIRVTRGEEIIWGPPWSDEELAQIRAAEEQRRARMQAAMVEATKRALEEKEAAEKEATPEPEETPDA